MARGRKRREVRQPAPLGRVLAVLRAALDLTQSDLARLSGVKRSSISEYERGRSTPDASTLERLLTAMRLRWTGLDLGSWFLDRLLTECLIPEGEDIHEGTAPLLLTASTLASRLSADVVSVSQITAKLSQLVLMLQSQKPEEPPSENGNPGTSGASDRNAAQALWTRIKGLSPKEQAEKIQHAPPGGQWAICEQLCLESQRLCGEDPAKAVSLCELALTAADLAEGGEGLRAKLRGLAWAHIGNALRARDDLQGAERAFISSEAFWKIGEGSAEGLLEEGLIFALKASLRRAQRRFDEATDLLERAAMLASTPAFRVQVLVSKAKLLEETGDLEEAVAILRSVKETVSPDEETRILFAIWHNLSDTLSKLERFEEAASALRQARVHCRNAGGQLNRIRLMWTEGRVTAGLGNVEEGLTLLARVRGEYASRTMAYDVALVSLEIAILYAKEGRNEQVKTLARHMTPIFQTHAIHREALAALTLFRQAAERERVTAAFAREVLFYLRKARYDPELRFEGSRREYRHAGCLTYRPLIQP
jgi:transcriptional regulator with XRE-family HTH domain/tetratricopeptide (TPR) repeat protein